MTKSVLIVTIPPLTGGVPTLARIVAEHLRQSDLAVTVAHYATLTDYPDLVAPSWRVVRGGRATTRSGQCLGGFPSLAVGCALPELEFTYYLPSPRWAEVIGAHDRHIAVGGTVLVSYPLTAMGVPHLIWCASTMMADRTDRRRSMPALRKAFDSLVIGPVQRRMEKTVLSGPGRFMTISDYTTRTLVETGGRVENFIKLPVPVDAGSFTPPGTPPRPGVIGFAGRPGDPRKNIPLLLDAVAILVARGCDVELRLTGDAVPSLDRIAEKLGISDRVHWQGWLPDGDLPAFLQSLDLFVIPSFQEGLNIAGLQAMACSVPVVSTRCGGPEDYVADGKTGRLVGFDGEQLAQAIQDVVGNRGLRDELGKNARRLVENEYSHDKFRQGLGAAWQGLWQERLPQ